MFASALLGCAVAGFLPGALIGAGAAEVLAAADSATEARRRFNRGDAAEALALYEQLAAIPAFESAARLNQATLLKNAGRYREAAVLYEQCTGGPAAAAVYAILAETYYLAAQPRKALAAAEAARARGCGSAWMLFWQARAHESAGEPAAAVAAYRQLVERDSEWVWAHFFLGGLYEKQGDWPAAVTAYERARELDPSITAVYPAIAGAYLRQGNYEAAVKAFQKVQAVDPKNVAAVEGIRTALRRGGKELETKMARRDQARVAATVPRVPAVSAPAGAPAVRVKLADAQRVRFKCNSALRIQSSGGAVDVAGGAQTVYTAEISGSGALLIREEQRIIAVPADAVKIIPQDSQPVFLIFDVETGANNYWANRTDRSYRGSLELRLAPPGRIRMINHIDLEDYLFAVVPSEMPAGWPSEALKTQAIAARSEAFVKMGRHAAEGFDYCADVHCQAYGGLNAETAATSRAVLDTFGQIAVYNGKAVDAVYCNSCGGHTQWNIFGQRAYIPYWTAKPDAPADQPLPRFPLSPWDLELWLRTESVPVFCNNSTFSRRSNFRWMRWYSRAELEKLIAEKYAVGHVHKIIIKERMPSGHIDRVEIVGAKQTVSVEKELAIRQVFGNLRSSMFNVETVLDSLGNPAFFLFYGGGWGHGVGMCQTGAATMAQEGYDAEEIIRFYFTGATLEKKY
ncbi:MAG: SpoIID/LytB domain-containing protein [Candidatus Omnitrophica bacterium]|nr:SpoIID/LytB domain-containing protein [Candidatus Omnitrophota bacterium]